MSPKNGIFTIRVAGNQMNIKELSEAIDDYSMANPYRPPYADVIAYEVIKYRLFEPESYDKVLQPDTTLESVWEKIVESDKLFTMEHGFEPLIEDVHEWLSEQHVWFSQYIDTIDVSIKWADDGKVEDQTIGIIPAGWTDSMEHHPYDVEVFYWVTKEEAKQIGKGFTNGEFIVEEIY